MVEELKCFTQLNSEYHHNSVLKIKIGQCLILKPLCYRHLVHTVCCAVQYLQSYRQEYTQMPAAGLSARVLSILGGHEHDQTHFSMVRSDP